MRYFRTVLVACAVMAAGCASFSHTNEKLTHSDPPGRATHAVTGDRGNPEVLVLLALSGGGSRAAYFSSAVMLELQKIFPGVDLLKEVDAISAVSGGALPAAYYGISHDPGAPPAAANREWKPETVRDLMSRNYIRRWVANWFWPNNIARFWFTAYDRSDIMAQTFADNLFDVAPTGRDLRFADLNPERPYIILNATNGTEPADDMPFGSLFTFTHEDFARCVNSDIGSYSIARAVMGSASFPAVFNYMTLANHHDNVLVTARPYLHVFDGGNVDNLGLTAFKRILLDESAARYKKIVVISVDSFTRSKGVPAWRYDARGAASYVIDFNLLDAIDSLLEANRDNLLADFQRGTLSIGRDCSKQNLPKVVCELPADELQRRQQAVRNKMVFFHATFNSVRNETVRLALNHIPTDFKILPADQAAIDVAVPQIVSANDPCLRYIRDIVTNAADTGTNPCR